MDAPSLLPFAKLPRGLAPLGYRDFFLYWIGQATTTTGRWVELTGVVWLVYELTDSPFLVGALGAARAIPSLVLSPLAGVISDRLRPRAMLFACQALAMAAALCLGLLVAFGVAELWHVYLQVTVQAAIQAFDAAARQTLYPRLVPRIHLANAVALGVTAIRVSKFLGPALGGLLIATLGESAPFLANFISYPGMLLALAAMRPLEPLLGVARTSIGAEFREGLQYLLAQPVLGGLLMFELVFGLFEMNMVMIAIIGREILGVGPQALGLLIAAPALGSFLGIAWLLAADQSVQSGRFSILCSLVYAGMLMFLSLSANYSMSFVALAVIGVLEVLITVNRNAIMQLATPEHLRGRVMANMGLVTRGIGPFSETQSGALASLIGPTLGIAAAAATIATAAGGMALARNALWRFRLNARE